MEMLVLSPGCSGNLLCLRLLCRTRDPFTDDVIKDVIYLSGFIVLSLFFWLLTSTFTQDGNFTKPTQSPNWFYFACFFLFLSKFFKFYSSSIFCFALSTKTSESFQVL